MIDAALLPVQKRLLKPLARRAVAAGLRADHITIAGFVIGLMMLPAFVFGAYELALVFILVNRLCDGLDGAVARLTQPTDRGAFLDIALDFLFYALVPLGFALAAPQENALAAAVLIAAFVGTGSSFLAFSTIASRRNIRSTEFPGKGIYYLGGLTEGAETISVFLLMCLFPTYFVPMAYVFACACLLTTLTRWYQGWVMFTDEREP